MENNNENVERNINGTAEVKKKQSAETTVIIAAFLALVGVVAVSIVINLIR